MSGQSLGGTAASAGSSGAAEFAALLDQVFDLSLPGSAEAVFARLAAT
jgi:hypothetical protein